MTKEEYIRRLKIKNNHLIEGELQVEVLDEIIKPRGEVRLKDRFGYFNIKVSESLFKERVDINFIKVALDKESYIEEYLKYKNPYLRSLPMFKVLAYNDRRDIVCETEFGKISSDTKSLLTTKLISLSFYIDKTQYFKNRSESLFKSQFSYEDVIVTRSTSKIKLYCNQHKGYINVLINNHFKGGGCGVCNKRGAYCKTASERNKERWKDEYMYFYLFKMWGNNEEFYKLGLSTSLENRMRKLKVTYEVFPLLYIRISKLNSHSVEDYFFHKYAECKYKPLKKFNGHTECFNFNKDEVAEVMNIMQFNVEERKYYYKTDTGVFDRESIIIDNLITNQYKSIFMPTCAD